MMHRVTVYTHHPRPQEPLEQPIALAGERQYYPATDSPAEALREHLAYRLAKQARPVCVFLIANRIYYLTGADGKLIESGAVTVTQPEYPTT